MQSILKECASFKGTFIDLNRLLVAEIFASMRKSHRLDFLEAKMRNDILTLQSVKEWLRKCFAIKDLGDTAYILGIKIYKDRESTLTSWHKDGPKTDEELDRMSRVPYAMAVGSIINTKDKLVYSGEEELRVTAYYDASWQTDKDDSHSQSACEASKEAIWMKNFNGDLRVVPTVQDSIEIFCDNESAVALTKEPKDHEKSKHIERKYHFVQSKVEEGHVIVKHIQLEDNPADPLTKALAKSRHV
ncbi:hypothetical protein Tco_1046689 [Tanacetum coccineum]